MSAPLSNAMLTSHDPSPTADGAISGECVVLDATATLPTRYGTFTSYVFRVVDSGAEHLALVMGDVANQSSVLTRLHSECLTGDVLGSYRCDCGEQLDLALRYIAAEGCGVLLYLRLPDDSREYDSAAGILRTLKVTSVRLMSNNPEKFDTLSKHGIPVCERVALAIPMREENERYIRTKQLKFGHYFDENE